MLVETNFRQTGADVLRHARYLGFRHKARNYHPTDIIHSMSIYKATQSTHTSIYTYDYNMHTYVALARIQPRLTGNG